MDGSLFRSVIVRDLGEALRLCCLLGVCALLGGLFLSRLDTRMFRRELLGGALIGKCLIVFLLNQSVFHLFLEGRG